MLYWSATVFMIPGTVLSIVVWLCNRYHYSQKASTEDVANTSSALSGVPSVMDLNEFVKQTKHIFGNRIFVLMLLLCVFNEGCYAAFQGSLKQFLKHKFNRAEKEVGVDIGVIMYFGLVAPLTGYMVDRLRHRELFILFGSSCVLLSHVILAFGVASDCNRWMGLCCISIGLVVYANAFWPAIASVAGKQYQIVAYGWSSALSSFGAVVIPMISGYFTDMFSIVAVEYVF
eukprot:74892_1